MAGLVKTSFRINLTEVEIEKVNTTVKKHSKYLAASWFMQIGWEDPERYNEWIKDDPTIVVVFDPYEMEQVEEGKLSMHEVTHATTAETYLNTVVSILEKVQQIEWRYPCFAVADLEDQKLYAALITELWPHMPQGVRNDILPNYFDAEWYGNGLRDFPMSVFKHNLKVLTPN